tara:strand:+ start:12418 stop:12726 length:309 start_codon:yes stop_codon:yes gene_type:complete
LDWLIILEQYGVPIAVAIAFGFFIWKQNKYIQDDLSKDIHQKFNRLEGILVKLIDQQKLMQLEQKGLENSYKALVEIIAKLSGNGLREKLLRIQERNNNRNY